MYKIKTADLKEFFKRAAFIKTNNILPVLQYIKVEIVGDGAILTKHNLSSFVTFEVPLMETPLYSETFLVEEKILRAYADREPDFIVLSYNAAESRVTIQRMEIPSPDIVDFPSVAKKETESIELGKELLNSLRAASSILDDKKTNYSYVHVFPDCVFSSNFWGAYYKRFPEGLPSIALGRDCCLAIDSFPTVNYSSGGNYDIFESGATAIGFVKPDVAKPRHEHVTSRLKREGGVTLESKQGLLNFMELCKISTDSLKHVITLSAKEGRLFLEFADRDFSVNNNVALPALINTPFAESDLNADHFAPFLKDLPYESISLNFTHTGQSDACIVYSTEDENFIGLTMVLKQQ